MHCCLFLSCFSKQTGFNLSVIFISFGAFFFSLIVKCWVTLRGMFAWRPLLTCNKSFCWIPIWNCKKTHFLLRVEILLMPNLNQSNITSEHQHEIFERIILTLLVFFEKDESAWKKQKKYILDNLAVLPISPHICQRACFDIKGPAVSLQWFIVMADDCELNDFQDLIKDWL